MNEITTPINVLTLERRAIRGLLSPPPAAAHAHLPLMQALADLIFASSYFWLKQLALLHTSNLASCTWVSGLMLSCALRAL
jgi:hypothetical protein